MSSGPAPERRQREDVQWKVDWMNAEQMVGAEEHRKSCGVVERVRAFLGESPAWKAGWLPRGPSLARRRPSRSGRGLQPQIMRLDHSVLRCSRFLFDVPCR